MCDWLQKTWDRHDRGHRMHEIGAWVWVHAFLGDTLQEHALMCISILNWQGVIGIWKPLFATVDYKIYYICYIYICVAISAYSSTNHRWAAQYCIIFSKGFLYSLVPDSQFLNTDITVCSDDRKTWEQAMFVWIPKWDRRMANWTRLLDNH